MELGRPVRHIHRAADTRARTDKPAVHKPGRHELQPPGQLPLQPLLQRAPASVLPASTPLPGQGSQTSFSSSSLPPLHSFIKPEGWEKLLQLAPVLAVSVTK